MLPKLRKSQIGINKTIGYNLNLKPNIFLYPLSLLYKTVVNIRNYLYDTKFLKIYKSSLKVICVGNVTAGGSGKSPFVQHLAKELYLLGQQPVILSRGYKSNICRPHQVSSIDTPSDVGDEAMMHFLELGDKANVVISKDRVEGVKFIERHNLGNIIILDDGYQHRRLNRDRNLLLLDISTDATIQRWNNGLLLPAGYLREPLHSAIERASSIIYISKNIGNSNSFKLHPSQYNFIFRPLGFEDCFSNKACEIKGEVSVVTSIAQPDSLIAYLEQMGLKIKDKFIYPDHHLFNEQDFNKFSKTSDILICTEKDRVKLKSLLQDENKIYSLKILGEFSNNLTSQDFFKNILSIP